MEYWHQTGLDMLNEVSHYEAIYQFMQNKKVLDLGANCGAFTYRALMSGADKVIAVEAGRNNFEFLSKQPFMQCFQGRVELINKAVVGKKKTKSVEFYEGTFGNTGLSGTQYRCGLEGFQVYNVDAVWFNDLINETRPDILKIDVEGSELDFDFKSIPECVKIIAIELHDDLAKIEEITQYICGRWRNIFSCRTIDNRREIVASL